MTKKAMIILKACCCAKATANPWGSLGLEWRTPSPPPLENFEVMPDMKEYGLYDYGKVYPRKHAGEEGKA